MHQTASVLQWKSCRKPHHGTAQLNLLGACHSTISYGTSCLARELLPGVQPRLSHTAGLSHCCWCLLHVIAATLLTGLAADKAVLRD